METLVWFVAGFALAVGIGALTALWLRRQLAEARALAESATGLYRRERADRLDAVIRYRHQRDALRLWAHSRGLDPEEVDAAVLGELDGRLRETITMPVRRRHGASRGAA